MMAAILLLLAILCCSSQHASAFLSPSPITKPLISCAEQTISTTESDGIATSRRSFAEDILGIGSISLAFLSSTPCYASGGATAGGAYLLSAKQRYNERKSAALVLLYLKVNVLTYVTISSLSSSQIVITRIFQG